MKEKKASGKTGSHGAVTVFLTLILIPCLIFTCAFGDISRVELSKSQAASAGDLALYSLMSNYDADLKEWYGLVASSQSIENFYDKTEQYFIGMLNANGLDGEGSELFSAYLSALAHEDGYSNFLQIEEVSDTKVGALATASLGENPALLEDGIVEFMKYRGPVVIVNNVIERFKQLDIIGKLKEAKENEPIVKKKQEYVEAEAEMMEDILGTYLALLQYKNFYEKNISKLGSDQYSQYSEKMSLIYEDMGAMHVETVNDKEYDYGGVTDLITKYYAFSADLNNISSSIPIVQGEPGVINGHDTVWCDTAYGMAEIGATQMRNENDELIDQYEISEAKVDALLNGLDTYIGNITNAAGSLQTAVKDISSPTGDANNDVNPVVYCMRFQNAVNSNDFSTMSKNANEMMVTLAKIMVANYCQKSEASVQKLAEAQRKIWRTRNNYLTLSNENTDYQRYMRKYTSTIGGVVDFVTNRKYSFNSNYLKSFGTETYVQMGSFLKYVREDLGAAYDLIDEQIKNIDLIINGGKVSNPNVDKEYKVLSLDKLKKVMKETAKKRDAWGTEASKHDTQFAKDEHNDYTGEAEKVSEGNAKKVFSAQTLAAQMRQDPETAVNELKTRLLNIRANLVQLKDDLDSFTYGGEKIKDLTRDTAITAFRNTYSTTCLTTDITLSGGTAQAAGYTKGLLKPEASKLYQAPVIEKGSTSNDPQIINDPPELAKYLMEAINESQLQSATDKKATYNEQVESLKESAKTQKAAEKNFDEKYVANLGSNPKKCTAGSPFTGFSAFTGIIDLVQTVIKGNYGQVRDQVYFVAYVLEMFSFSTFDNEGQVQYAEKKDNKILTLTDFVNSDKGYHYPNPYYQTWTTFKPTDFTDNLTLTNYAINKENNYSNLAEIEYILYGQETNKENLKKAYDQIFAIREPLNLISGFQNFYTGNNDTALFINAIADAICAATCGLVPIPAIKAALILVLSTLESIHDLQRIKAGVQVAIYKIKPEEWYCSMSRGTGSSTSLDGVMKTEGGIEPQDQGGLYYSDYITFFLLLAANNKNTYSKMLQRTGDLIEANMKTKFNDKFSLNKSICYFSLESTLKVKPLLMTLPIANSMEGVDTSILSEKTDWCTYSVKYVRGYS